MEKISEHFHCIMIIGSAIFSVVSWIGMVYLFQEANTPYGSIIIGAYFTSVGWFGASVVAGANELATAKRHSKLSASIRAILKSQKQSEETSKMIESKLEAIESKLESADNDTESAPTGRPDEPVHSDHIGR